MSTQNDLPTEMGTHPGLSRRNFIAASTGLAGSIIAEQAAADSLADVPPREPGADLGGTSERSKYVKLARIPQATPGKRNVDPSDAINSKTPLDKLFGATTPSDLHYERSHSGVPDLDPARHRLLVHGMVHKPLVLNVEDLKAMPSISRTVFIECTGNGWGVAAAPCLERNVRLVSARWSARAKPQPWVSDAAPIAILSKLIWKRQGQARSASWRALRRVWLSKT
jgi:sulfane dehydrogenase subunit SoxC